MTLHARDVMKPSPMTVPPSMTLAELERTLLEARIGGAPVVDAGRVVGLVSRSDIVKQVSVGQALADHLAQDFYQDISGFAHGDEGQAPVDPSILVGTHLTTVTVKDAMVEQVISVSPDAPVSEVAYTMVENAIHRVLVMEGEALVGIISSADLVRLLARQDLALVRR